jgi:hypothetical protein
MNTYPGPQAGY